MTTLLLMAGAGALLGVLWMDLMFDVQVLGRSGDLPEPVLASIAGYYRRVTTDAWPMGAAIAAAMALAAGSAAWQLVRRAVVDTRRRAPAGLPSPSPSRDAASFPNAARLGRRADSVAEQSRLARAVCRDHLACLAMMLAVVAAQMHG